MQLIFHQDDGTKEMESVLYSRINKRSKQSTC